MDRVARRKAASLVDMDLGLGIASPVEADEEIDQPAAGTDAERAEVEETLGKIASIIRGMER